MERNTLHTRHLTSASHVFILGILPRSGTNFLSDLLRMHPDCTMVPIIREDYLLREANHIETYISSVYQRWRPSRSKVDESFKEDLYQSIGSGIISFLNSRTEADKILVTKTPSVNNLSYFFKLFPRSHLLILVRDGRAVVESMARSFGRDYEDTMQRWAKAANTILTFEETAKQSDCNYLIVKYENLLNNNSQQELRRIFDFLGLNAANYDFEAAENIPVRGSSELSQKGRLHWKKVEKTASFKPELRWKNWKPAKHRRFNWIAGKYLVKFGYEESKLEANQPLWAIWNKLLDMKWLLKSSYRSIKARFQEK